MSANTTAVPHICQRVDAQASVTATKETLRVQLEDSRLKSKAEAPFVDPTATRKGKVEVLKPNVTWGHRAFARLGAC